MLPLFLFLFALYSGKIRRIGLNFYQKRRFLSFVLDLYFFTVLHGIIHNTNSFCTGVMWLLSWAW